MTAILCEFSLFYKGGQLELAFHAPHVSQSPTPAGASERTLRDSHLHWVSPLGSFLGGVCNNSAALEQARGQIRGTPSPPGLLCRTRTWAQPLCADSHHFHRVIAMQRGQDRDSGRGCSVQGNTAGIDMIRGQDPRWSGPGCN